MQSVCYDISSLDEQFDALRANVELKYCLNNQIIIKKQKKTKCDEEAQIEAMRLMRFWGFLSTAPVDNSNMAPMVRKELNEIRKNERNQREQKIFAHALPVARLLSATLVKQS